MKAVIVTRQVGQRFGCKALVMQGEHILYETRVFPLHHENQAIVRAKSWCDENGIAAEVKP